MVLVMDSPPDSAQMMCMGREWWREVCFEPVLPVVIGKKPSPVGIVVFFVRSGLPRLDACIGYGAARGCGADSSSQNLAGTIFHDSGSLNSKAN